MSLSVLRAYVEAQLGLVLEYDCLHILEETLGYAQDSPAVRFELLSAFSYRTGDLRPGLPPGYGVRRQADVLGGLSAPAPQR